MHRHAWDFEGREVPEGMRVERGEVVDRDGRQVVVVARVCACGARRPVEYSLVR